jgi:hypothetical protein
MPTYLPPRNAGGSLAVTIYYLGRDARITDLIFESRCPVYQRFEITELKYPHTVHEDAMTTVVLSTPVRVCSGGAMGVAGLAAAIGWPVFDKPTMTATGLVVFGLATVAALGVRRLRRRPLEIRAVYRGSLVCLFSTTDRRTLGQVSRALLRVIEHHKDAR